VSFPTGRQRACSDPYGPQGGLSPAVRRRTAPVSTTRSRQPCGSRSQRRWSSRRRPGQGRQVLPPAVRLLDAEDPAQVI